MTNYLIDFIGYTGKTGSIIYNYLKNKFSFQNLVNSKNYKEYMNYLVQKNSKSQNILIIDFSSKSFILELVDFLRYLNIDFEKDSKNVFYLTGVTGFEFEDYQKINQIFSQKKIYGFHFPNFSIGMNLINDLVTKIAQYFDNAEIIEMHHNSKKDKPSGTSIMTSNILKNSLNKNIPIHSIRLPSLVAHQTVIFSNEFGEVLQITHHNLNRLSFALGVDKVIGKIIADDFEKLKETYRPGFHYNLNLINFLGYL